MRLANIHPSTQILGALHLPQDSSNIQLLQVDKLKLLSESLVRSANKAEKEISDDRLKLHISISVCDLFKVDKAASYLISHLQGQDLGLIYVSFIIFHLLFTQNLL